MQSKDIICQILVKISDIDYDKRISKFLGYFKLEMQENGDKYDDNFMQISAAKIN